MAWFLPSFAVAPNGVEAPRSAPATLVLLGQATCCRHSFLSSTQEVVQAGSPSSSAAASREGQLDGDLG